MAVWGARGWRVRISALGALALNGIVAVQAARAQDLHNPFDDPADPFRKRSSVAATPSPRAAMPAAPLVIGSRPLPSPVPYPGSRTEVPPAIPSVPGAARPVTPGGTGTASACFAVDRLEFRDDELRACWILLQREVAAGRGTDLTYLHLSNLYHRLRDLAHPAASSVPANVPAAPGREAYSAMMPAAAVPAPAPAAAPRNAVRDELLERRRREPGARPVLQDLAFYEMFLGFADRALEAWEAAGPESPADLQYRLVHALLKLSLGQYDDGGRDLEQAVRLVDRRRPFALQRAGFVTSVAAFRDFAPRAKGQPFRAGEAFRLYAELERTAFSRFADDYVINVAVALSLFDARGERVWRDTNLPPYSLAFRGPVRDLHLLVQHVVPEALEPGDYTLVLHARDQYALQDAEIGVPLTVTDGKRPPVPVAGRAGASGEARTDADPPRERDSVLKQIPRPPPPADLFDDPDLFGLDDPVALSGTPMRGRSGPSPAVPAADAAGAGSSPRPSSAPAAAVPARNPPATVAAAPLSAPQTDAMAASPNWAAFNEKIRKHEDYLRQQRDYQRQLEDGVARREREVENDRARQERDLARERKAIEQEREELDRRRKDMDRRQDQQLKAMQSTQGAMRGLLGQ